MNSYIQFCKGLDKHINKTFATLLKQSEAENQAVISKHLEAQSKKVLEVQEIGEEITLRVPRLFKKEYIIKYSILSWYLDPWTQFELQEFLRKKCTQLGFFEIEALYLYSKELMLYTIFSENDCSHGSLFGNILQPGVYENITVISPEKTKKLRVKKSDFIFLSLKQRKPPKKKVYRRGYNDHGSMPPWDKKARTEANMLLDYYERELERQRSQLHSKNKQLEYLYEMKLKGIGS